MIYNLVKKDNHGNHEKPEGDFFVLTSRGEVLRLSRFVQGGAYYQVLGSSDKRFVTTRELREGVALFSWEILTNVVEAEAIAVLREALVSEEGNPDGQGLSSR